MTWLLEQELYLLLTAGLSHEEARAARLGGDASRVADGKHWNAPESLEALRGEASRAALRGGFAPRWPEPQAVAALAERLRAEGARLAWRGQAAYPSRMAARLDAPPAWVWMAGSPERLAGSLACSIVGSRRSPDRLLEAAWALGRALALAGVTVASGLAAGADSAAHAGAASAGPDGAGTLAIPARGLLWHDLARARGPEAVWMFLALDRPWAPFSAGLAVRRDAVIAAMGEGLVLVASELTGGSCHAARWALTRRHPLWCFEDGARTPAANRHLLRAGLARPLALVDGPEAWTQAIKPALAAQAEAHATEDDAQPRQLALFA